MVIAALVCFTILFIAWLLAPDHPRAATPAGGGPGGRADAAPRGGLSR